jgi:hypothetical protein
MAQPQPTPHVSAIPLNSFTPSLPHELWREIFQLATFIPDELEISDIFRPGIFGDQSGRQKAAWREVLPLRAAIQNVSRLWHSIGVELLYQSFHTDYWNVKVPRLASTLRIKPSYGLLVKRLRLLVSVDNADNIFILRSCPNVLILSTDVNTGSIPVALWDAFSLLTSLRHLQVDASYAHPNLEGETPPVPVGPFILPNLRHFHLSSRFHLDGILTPESILSLPCLTSLSFEVKESSPAPLLCKDLLRRLTYLRLQGRSLLPYLFQEMEFPLLRIFQFDGHRMPLGTLLSECPNLPIQQIDILILASLSGYVFHEWCAGLHCILTEARDPKLMPKLKHVILEERITGFIRPKDLYPTYEDLISCYGPLVDAFESRGVELSLRIWEGIWKVDVPVREFILQMESCLPSSST